MRSVALYVLVVTLLLAPALRSRSAAPVAKPMTSAAKPPPYAGVARGNLTVDRTTVVLKYAYAVSVDDVEDAGFLLSGPEKYDAVLLCDRALPLRCVSNRNLPFADRDSPAEMFEPLTPSPADTIYGVLLKLDTAKGSVLESRLICPGRQGVWSAVGAENPDRVSGLAVVNGVLSGTAFLPKPQQTGLDTGPEKYSYHAAFRAPLLAEPPVTMVWQGKTLPACPLLKSLRQYFTAAKYGKISKLRRLTASNHLPYLDKPEVRRFLHSGDPTAIVAEVKRVVARGASATAVIVRDKPNYDQTDISMAHEDGLWKVCWP